EGGDLDVLKRLHGARRLGAGRCTLLLPHGQYQFQPIDAPEVPAERPFRIHYHAGSKHLSLTWDDDYLPVSAQVISPEGKTITIACPRNDQEFRLDFSRLAAGNYVLRLLDRNGLPRIARFVVL
ncbi:MAG TPA: hypothetical protein PLI08_04900, partial [Bacteroidia bacterium]|nr:hypothetical protein [Bacteroidia bacterium]